MEFYAFIHFGINTFTGQEWGDGQEDPELFQPSELDAGQWVRACRNAGMTGVILTAKHHDGFCLWPSEYTEHSVKNSSWRHSQGDVVREVAEACAEYGLKFGFYLSPWDQHDRRYGTEAHNTYFKNQLRELLTNYGDVFCVWFDGACGEGPNGRRQIYDWEGYYQVIRELQPEAVIANCGPDVRWCGNEAGQARESEWSVVPAALKDVDRIRENSQQQEDQELTAIDEQDQDLGSREKIKQAEELVWYPAEVDVSIRPSWFYHSEEDEQVKSLSHLQQIYLDSVGGNACLLLNVPPDKRGLFQQNDVQRLQELGNWINDLYSENLVSDAEINYAGEVIENQEACRLIDGKEGTCWLPDISERENGPALKIVFTFPEIKKFNYIVIQEDIARGQRVEKFSIQVEKDRNWKTIYQDTVIGYKNICHFDSVETQRIKLIIERYRWRPVMSNFAVYNKE